MTPHLVPPGAWADEGRRAASALEEVTAAIITGRDPEATAEVALGIARVHAAERRVAVADLVGGIPVLTPLADQPGLLECLRDGESLSAIGQPLADTDNVYLLPSGLGAINERWVFESARWTRLVAGFREVDALLLLVCSPSAPGLATLIERVDGVVAVDLPPTDIRQWPLLATVDHPEPELPPIAVRRPDAQELPASKRGRGLRRALFAALAAVVLGGGGLAWWALRAPDPGTIASGTSAAEVPEAPPPAAIEVTLGPLVNPGDSANAAIFSVELVAANTLASANSALVSRVGPFPTATIAPVLLGAASSPWYRALSGAWTDREAAERWLATERSRGVLRASVGRVIAVPYALLLADSLSQLTAEPVVARWTAAGVRAYGLQQEDGSVRVFAGAFETASQAAWLASTLRDAGETPRLAYRTGRMY